jgi:hypothetical protein
MNTQAELDEVAKRGHAIFDKKIAPTITPKDKGKFVAIDVDSGEFAMAGTSLLAFKRIHAKQPDCRAFLMRVGYRTATKFGRRVRGTP